MPDKHHQRISPELIASADRMHARGRNMFAALLNDYRNHKDSCTDPDCDLAHNEEVAVARFASEMYVGMFTCDHMDCAVLAIQTVCEALTYVGVRIAEGRSVDG